MAASKIAPTLWRYVNHGGCDPYNADRALKSELRALLRVARAARMHSHAECAYDPIDESRLCGICRALAALDKAGASGARSRKGGR